MCPYLLLHLFHVLLQLCQIRAMPLFLLASLVFLELMFEPFGSELVWYHILSVHVIQWVFPVEAREDVCRQNSGHVPLVRVPDAPHFGLQICSFSVPDIVAYEFHVGSH